MYFEPQATFQNGYNIWLSPGSPGFNSRRWKFCLLKKGLKTAQAVRK